jgi:hypothetical protein
MREVFLEIKKDKCVLRLKKILKNETIGKLNVLKRLKFKSKKEPKNNFFNLDKRTKAVKVGETSLTLKFRKLTYL